MDMGLASGARAEFQSLLASWVRCPFAVCNLHHYVASQFLQTFHSPGLLLFFLCKY